MPLFALENPLSARLGVGFFKSVPSRAGVYFFRDVESRLLYIGQSHDLRARIGSYRHLSLDRNPRRLLRLVHRITHVEWVECEGAAEAIELERKLLLEHRPPFNRAGVWPGYAWWMTVKLAANGVHVGLSRQAGGETECMGPFPAGLRYAHASLMRCVFRYLNPECSLGAYPLGLLNLTVPLSMLLKLEAKDGKRLVDLMVGWVSGQSDELLVILESVVGGKDEREVEYWAGELESLRRFFKKRRSGTDALKMPAAPPLPMFPEW